MKNAIQLYLKLLQFPNNKEITVTTINEQYRAIIDKKIWLSEKVCVFGHSEAKQHHAT